MGYAATKPDKVNICINKDFKIQNLKYHYFNVVMALNKNKIIVNNMFFLVFLPFTLKFNND